MKIKYALLIIFTFCALLLIFYKHKNNEKNITPILLNKNHICANDSMIIINYKGPKAQIIWKDNSVSFFCEVKEAFHEKVIKVKYKNIKKIFVQNFDNLEWGSYTNNWQNAENLYYVIDSSVNGAMGVTYVPFIKIENAKNFQKKNGGKILHFNEINEQTLKESNKILKNLFQ